MKTEGMTKFNVGDKVRIVRQVSDDCTHNAKIGGIAEITSRYSENHYGCAYPSRFGGISNGWITRGSIEAIKESPARRTTRRLTEAEAEIETLKCQLYSVEKNLGRKIRDLETVLADRSKLTRAPVIIEAEKFGRLIAEGLARGIAKAPKQTPNQRRADVIKRAQAYVEKYEGDEGVERGVGNSTARLHMYETDFTVKGGKVTAVVYRLFTGHGRESRPHHVGRAVCSEGDVFNAIIGKAIAIGRALGVDIPQEFFDAPNPTEVVVGQIVRDRVGGLYAWDDYKVEKIEGTLAFDSKMQYASFQNLAIIDDTDAVYE